MATTSEMAVKVNDEVAEKQLKELIAVEDHDEYDSRLGKISNTLANWMKYVFNMDSSKEEVEPVWLSIDEYKSLALESMNNAWRIVTLPNWNLEKRGTVKGDIVESRKVDGFGKVYRFTGLVNCPAKFLFEEFKNNLTKLPEWNPTVLKCDIIKEVGEGVDLSYQVTAGGGRGIISPRDFVILRRTAGLSREGRITDQDPHAYICTGTSVTVPGYPPIKDLVRGHNKVGCWYLQPRNIQTAGGRIEHQTLFQWLMCCDLKGKIPQFVLDAAFATVMLEYIVHVRKFVAEAKSRAEF